MAKKSEISIVVSLDENNLPEKIEWDSTDSNQEGVTECKAMAISLFDAKANDLLGLDLWTKEMMVNEMEDFIYNHLLKTSDTYMRATQDEDGAKIIAECAEKFLALLDAKNRNADEKDDHHHHHHHDHGHDHDHKHE